MRHAIPLAFAVLLTGCSLLWQDDDDYVYSSARALTVEVEDISNRAIAFDYVGFPPSVCDEYATTRTTRDGRVITVDLRLRVPAETACIALAPPPFERRVTVRVDEPGTYTFRFPAGRDGYLTVEATVP